VYAEVVGKARMQYVPQEVAGCGSGVQASCIHVVSRHACQDYASWAMLPVCEVTDFEHVQCVHVALAGCGSGMHAALSWLFVCLC
jgi:hypothetical protein